MNKIRITESALRRIVKESVRKVLSDHTVNEGFGNWVKAGVNGLSDMRKYTEGPTKSKLVNFTNNVARDKKHMDYSDDYNKYIKYVRDYDSPYAKNLRAKMMLTNRLLDDSPELRKHYRSDLIKSTEDIKRAEKVRDERIRRKKYGY